MEFQKIQKQVAKVKKDVKRLQYLMRSIQRTQNHINDHILQPMKSNPGFAKENKSGKGFSRHAVESPEYKDETLIKTASGYVIESEELPNTKDVTMNVKPDDYVGVSIMVKAYEAAELPDGTKTPENVEKLVTTENDLVLINSSIGPSNMSVSPIQPVRLSLTELSSTSTPIKKMRMTTSNTTANKSTEEIGSPILPGCTDLTKLSDTPMPTKMNLKTTENTTVGVNLTMESSEKNIPAGRSDLTKLSNTSSATNKKLKTTGNTSTVANLIMKSFEKNIPQLTDTMSATETKLVITENKTVVPSSDTKTSEKKDSTNLHCTSTTTKKKQAATENNPNYATKSALRFKQQLYERKQN